MPLTHSIRRLTLVAAFLLVSTRAGAADFCGWGADPGFNAGLPVDDDFGPGTNTSRRLVRAANGDLIVAAIASASGGLNIGLARYDSAGQRVFWSGLNNPYVIYPNTGAYYSVTDVKVAFGKIFVLADVAGGARIVVFDDSGAFVADIGAFASGNPEHGAGLVPYSYTYTDKLGHLRTAMRLIAVASLDLGGSDYADMARFYVSADGTPSIDTTFGMYGTGYTVPANVFPGAVAAAATDTSSPRVYVAGEDSAGHAVVVGVDGNSGSTLAAFGSPGGGIYVGPDPYNSADVAVTTGGTAASDVLYLLVYFTQTPYNGYVIKLVQVPGSGTVAETGWGDGYGQAFVGFTGKALAVDGSRVVTAGAAGSTPALASFTLTSGSLEASQDFASFGSSPFVGVVPIAGTPAYGVSGDRGAAIGTTRLLITCDGIFRNGFE